MKAMYHGDRESVLYLSPDSGSAVRRDIIMLGKSQRLLLLGVASLLSILLLSLSCARKDAELVYRAYEYASVYPEAFDNYAIEHLFSRADEFASCAAQVREVLAEQFARVTEHCTNLDPEYRDACFDVDETRVAIMLDAMVATARQQTLYTQTLSGQAAVMGKPILGAGNWERIQRQLAPVFRPALLCND